MTGKVRIDKWLWAARFFKTRSIARTAISGGKVHLNGARVKPGRPVNIQDSLRIQRGEEEFTVSVLLLNDRRGPASEAQQMYVETQESRLKREAEAEARSLTRSAKADRPGRPDKKQRRRIIQFRGERD